MYQKAFLLLALVCGFAADVKAEEFDTGADYTVAQLLGVGNCPSTSDELDVRYRPSDFGGSHILTGTIYSVLEDGGLCLTGSNAVIGLSGIKIPDPKKIHFVLGWTVECRLNSLTALVGGMDARCNVISPSERKSLAEFLVDESLAQTLPITDTKNCLEISELGSVKENSTIMGLVCR